VKAVGILPDESRKAETCSKSIKCITSAHSLYCRNRIINILPITWHYDTIFILPWYSLYCLWNLLKMHRETNLIYAYTHNYHVNKLCITAMMKNKQFDHFGIVQFKKRLCNSASILLTQYLMIFAKVRTPPTSCAGCMCVCRSVSLIEWVLFILDLRSQVTIKSAVFWDVTACRPVGRFGGIYYHHLQVWRVSRADNQ
jgi:hypothetical protein